MGIFVNSDGYDEDTFFRSESLRRSFGAGRYGRRKQMFTLEQENYQPPSFYGSYPRPSFEQPSSVCSVQFSALTTTSTPKRNKLKIKQRDSEMFMINRQEFHPGEPNGESRNKKRRLYICQWIIIGIIIGIIALITGLLVYFLTPTKVVKVNQDIEDEIVWDKVDAQSLIGDYRLPKDVEPTYYRLKIKPNFSTLTFDGTVSIAFLTKGNSITSISLHSKNLEILNGTTLMKQDIVTTTEDAKTADAASSILDGRLRRFAQNEADDNSDKGKAPILTQAKSSSIRITSTTQSPEFDRLTFNLETSLNQNENYVLEINFKGKIDDSLTGFYRSTYRDADNQTRTLGVTHMEPTAARKVFPCFDEPEFKAMFEISIARNKTMKVLANTQLDSEDNEGDIVWSHFKRSQRMSTYLVAFVIFDFESRDAVKLNSGDIPIKIWARKEMLPQTQYAAEITPKLLNFYEKFFGIRFTLPKLDLVAIPDFGVGAMENWGLITFGETNLLLDPQSVSMNQKKNIALVIAHELAHQWFGNLVTMKWWNDLWLKEGFATYMEYIGVNEIEPNWALMDQFNLDRMSILDLDSVRFMRPVSDLVNNKYLVGQMFDDIAYMKAASILRMLNNVLTEDTFQKGLLQFMQIWKFKNADRNDLWNSFSSVVSNTTRLPDKVSVTDFMDSWILQSGYPVINVNRHFENGTATVTQNRFYLTKPPKNDQNNLWHIPISYTVAESPQETWSTVPNAWIEKTPKTIISLPDGSNSSWLYCNIKAIGFYRVNYDYKNWKLLQFALDDDPFNFSAITRVQLLDDAFSLAQAGQLNYTVPLDLSKYMINTENHFMPWYAVLSNMQFIYSGMLKSSKYEYFQDYVSRLISPMLTTLTFNPNSNDTVQDGILRDQLLYWSCLIEDQQCIDWAQNHFSNWLNQSDPDKLNPIPNNHRFIVYTTVLRVGGKSEYDFLFERFSKSNDPTVRSDILSSLPSTKLGYKINSLLEYSITELELQLVPTIWSACNTEISQTIAFNFVLENWNRIYSKLSVAGDQLITFVVGAAFGNLATEQDLYTFKRFIQQNKKDLMMVSRNMQKYVDMAVLRIEWTKSRREDIERWLIKYFETKSTTVNEYSTLYVEYGSLSEMSQNFGEYLHTLLDANSTPAASFFMG